MESQGKNLRVALIQFKNGPNKQNNIDRACQLIRQAKYEYSPRVIALPECFIGPYGNKYFDELSEPVPTGETCLMLSSIAKEAGVYIIGGTIIESSDTKLYNTCTVWSPDGELIGKHRKVHLFDADVKGDDSTTMKESDLISAGNSLSVVEIDGIKVGIGICYDIQFEEMARVYCKRGCEMIFYPSAFTIGTGPLFWELVARSRANDNQLFVVAISPARNTSLEFVTWGHSMIVNPWGQVVKEAGIEEEIIVADLDFNLVKDVRNQIPFLLHRRHDLYETVDKNSN